MAEESNPIAFLVRWLSLASSLALGAAARSSLALAHALAAAEERDLLAAPASARVLAPSPLAAVSGVVALAPGAEAIVSLSSARCAVVEELLQVRRRSSFSSGGGGGTYDERVGVSYKDAPFLLTDGPAPTASVSVERSALLRAAEGSAGSVRRALVSGGAVIEPPDEATFSTRLFRALFFGVVDGERVRRHSVLLLASAVTVVGRLEMQSGGQLVVSAHPAVGLFVLPRGDLPLFIRELRQSALFTGLGALALGAFSVFGMHAFGDPAQWLDSLDLALARLRMALFGSAVTAAPKAAGAIAGGDSAAAAAMCAVCLERPVSTVLVPCGHRALCSTCGTRIAGRCPICRARVREVVHVYDAV